MSPTLLISIVAFVGVAAAVGSVAVLLREKHDKGVEQRLDVLTGLSSATAAKDNLLRDGLLSAPLDAGTGIIEGIMDRFGKLRLLFEQADTTLTPARLFAISAALAVLGAFASIVAGFPAYAMPVGAVAMASLPLLWLSWRRSRRLKSFAVQLPDALELIARALRAGHSLGSGFNLVREEMAAPIGKEFGRVFEEQNLGIPMDDSLSSLTARVPNLDLKFFATAIVLQRQTGGDLAEILDKIGYIVRERFKIWGQVQALTGEGRLSGIVLLGLPPVLFLAVYRLNPDYIMMLFTDPMGKKMLAGAVIMQVLGALVIRKIINIKVEIVLFADLVNFEQLLPLAAFGLFALGAWWLLDLLATGRSRAAQRLDELKNPALRRREPTGVTKKQDAMTKVLAAASPALAAPLRPKSELEANKLKLKLSNGGFRGESAPTIFLGFKFLGLIVGLFGSGSVLLLLGNFTQKSTMTSLLIAGALFYLPDIVLMFIIKRRKEAIFLGLPDALDLMVVCVEAGLGLDQAMRKVSDEMRRIYRVIADEFALSNFQLQVGRSRTDVLHELGVRTGVDDLRSLSAILIQADKFGSSIAQALRVQSDSMRTRRRQLAEEKAAKTAVKLIFPLVIFIFPGIFVVLVGPAAITMVREMFPMMQSGS